MSFPVCCGGQYSQILSLQVIVIEKRFTSGLRTTLLKSRHRCRERSLKVANKNVIDFWFAKMFLWSTFGKVRGPAVEWLSKVPQGIQRELSNTIRSESFLKFNNANPSRQFGISKSVLSNNITYFWQRAAWCWASRSKRDKKRNCWRFIDASVVPGKLKSSKS